MFIYADPLSLTQHCFHAFGLYQHRYAVKSIWPLQIYNTYLQFKPTDIQPTNEGTIKSNTFVETENVFLLKNNG